MFVDRVLSGMRPTGALHLGHYHGVLKNWIKLQNEYDCLFMVADWHALTTHYQNPHAIKNHTFEMVVDWLAAGIDPNQSILFVQSQVPEHAELHLLLSMMTPLGWLERVPSYKEQQEKLSDRDLSTYGFLGYPLLQSADILIYRANRVPVGEDQVPHLELTREICRRFNYLFGREPDFEAKALAAIKKMGPKKAKLYLDFRTRFNEQGSIEALEAAKALIADTQNLTVADRERVFGFLEGGQGKMILVEPQVLLTESPKMGGLDGQKMSKSYQNTISLRDDSATVTHKIRTMPTDPARVRRHDPGEPTLCPVFSFHRVYSTEDTQNWVTQGCRSAGIGCLECKQPVIDAVERELKPIRQRMEEFTANPMFVRNILADGAEAARKMAQDTLRDVREGMGLEY